MTLLGWQLLALVILVGASIAINRTYARRRASLIKMKRFEENQARLRSNPESSISLAELREIYADEQAAWQRQFDENEEALRRWRAVSYDSMEVARLLEDATSGEKESIAKFIELPADTNPNDLVGHICKAGSHSFASMMRMGRHIEYQEIAQDVAYKLGVKKNRKMPAYIAEKEAVVAAFNSILEKATPEQRSQIVANLSQQQGVPIKGMVGVTGGLVAAHLSGFALYTAASSTLAAVAGVAGVTLPFAAFATMSSVLSIATGPVGWAMVAGWVIYGMGGPDYKKTIPCVLTIATVRARLNNIKENEVRKLEAFRDGSLANEQKSLESIRGIIKRHEQLSADTLFDRDIIFKLSNITKLKSTC